MDHVYELPYMRAWHPSYDKLGGVPALKEIKFSLTSNRGCFGGCSFCAADISSGKKDSGAQSGIHYKRGGADYKRSGF